ncbi:hypothetical protein [Evansella clarkii]|jgi:hypothetical protein|nr:hypothetical protein [Evansella clarkii]
MKKFMLSIVSGVFALGMVTGCGDVENDPGADDPTLEDNGFNDGGTNEDF